MLATLNLEQSHEAVQAPGVPVGPTRLPAELALCTRLSALHLEGCAALIGLPDLSSLKSLTVHGLPKRLEPWHEEHGRRAWEVPGLAAVEEGLD